MKIIGLVFLIAGLLITSVAAANLVYTNSAAAKQGGYQSKFQEATVSFTPYLGFSMATIGLAIHFIARREA
jgi:hypothetical protein